MMRKSNERGEATMVKRKKKYKCVYCGCPIPYEGSCESCGRKEDVALGKIELI